MEPVARHGWTMVESLVVVAIIVILASLLTSAVDKSVYEALLARCQADQRSIGIGVIAYAGQHGRSYPHRPGVANDTDWSPPVIADNEPERAQKSGLMAQYQDRTALKGYVQINDQLNCSMAQRVDLENADDRTRVMASQALWFGWRYEVGRGPLPGMLKLGDRFEWGGRSFAILASDWTTFSREDNFAIGSHPDRYDGIMALETLENEQTFWWLFDPLTYSYWVSPETSWPGPVDRTFLYDDGSVRRMIRVEWRAATDQRGKLLRSEQFWERADERMVRVPERVKNDPTRSTHLPKD